MIERSVDRERAERLHRYREALNAALEARDALHSRDMDQVWNSEPGGGLDAAIGEALDAIAEAEARLEARR